MFLQCFDTVGWVIRPVKPVPDMTYNVFGGTLSLNQSINWLLLLLMMIMMILPSTSCNLLQLLIYYNIASVVCQRGGQIYARPLLRSLHWLPVKHRVTYKMAALTFKTMSSSTLVYLNDLIQTAVPVHPLRSDIPLLNVPRTRTEFTRRSFLVTAPYTWNSLPSDIRSHRTVYTFKRHLKTHLFSRNLMTPVPLKL